MPPRDNIQTRGTVTEILKDGAYRVELANGHRCIARASREHRLDFTDLSLGDRVQLEFHPYDLSRGRIVPPG
jgi:translation initiation factor IF-1